MSKTCNNTVIVKTLERSGSGLTQPERQLTAMQEAFYAIEERRFSEWMAYLRNAAQHIRFYDTGYLDEPGQAPNQNWRSALPDAAQSLALETLLVGGVVSKETKALAARPDIAALLTFFTLMAYPKQQFAQFTDQHKQHYYQTVLGFKPQPAAPDSVNLVISLSDEVSSMTLPAGTRFNGGQDVNDQPLVYQTLANAVLNHAQVARLDTLSGTLKAQRILARHIDVDKGLELDPEGAPTFGFGNDVIEPVSPQQSHAQIGFTLATPALFLSGGERQVKLRLHSEEDSENTLLQLNTWFDIFVSTAQGMVLLNGPSADTGQEEQPTWSIEEPALSATGGQSTAPADYDLRLTFNSWFPAITGLEGDLAPGVSALPHLQFLLRAEQDSAAFSLKKSLINQVSLDIEVSDLTGIVAENQSTILDTSGPIEPFTYQPAIGSRFTFTHPELLVKRISSASLNLHWLGRPGSLLNYYKAYSYYRYTVLGDDNYRNVLNGEEPSTELLAATEADDGEDNGEDNGAPVPNNESLDADKADIWSQLQWPDPSLTQGRSDSITPMAEQALFSQREPVNNIDQHTLPFIEPNQSYYPNGRLYDWQNLPFQEGAASLWPKFYSLTLANNDFGHGDFSQVAQFIAYYNAQQLQTPDTPTSEGGSGGQASEGGFIPIQVSTPYTPVLSRVSLNYHSTTEVAMAELAGFKEPFLQFMHPIGRPRIPPGDKISLLPAMTGTAYLYIGLKQVKTPGQVRLYFQIDPVSGSNISDDYGVYWHYLTLDGWQAIRGSSVGAQAGNARIMEDSTQQLLNSGILAIEFPAIDEQLSALGDDILWLQVAIQNGDPARVNYSNIKGVYTQGVAAQLVADNIDATHFRQPLAALSVSELELADPRISAVMQPWPSVGGSVQETAAQLAVRASERLRHKQRALTCWDYEHLVLNQFPEVYLARCYAPQNSEVDVELMLVPVNYDGSILQPKLPLYLHERIQRFIRSLCPPYLEVKVRDPLYQEVTFDVALKIYAGYDIDSVVSGLNQKLIDYLTPWQGSASQQVNFRQAIYLTDLAAMLEQDEAVDVVHHLKASITFKDQVIRIADHVNIIKPIVDIEGMEAMLADEIILVPSKKQKITLVDQDVEIIAGIGRWRIEIDFEVG